MKQTKPQKLISYLINESEHWTSATLLADLLDVSTRQIRKYISKINEDANCDLIISSNLGYRIDIDLYYKQDFNENDTPSARINFIIQKLVSEKNGYDLFDLADELYVSNATIENDLKEVRQTFHKFDLSLNRDKNLLIVDGNEKNMRKLMNYLITSDSYDHFVLKDEVRMLTFHYHFWEFRTTIREIFASNDIFVNDYTLNNIALHLIIMIDRLRNNRSLKNSNEIEKVKGTQQYHVALQIKKYIENDYQVMVNDAELYNLILVISNSTTMIDYNFITSENISQFIEQKYIDITKKVIHNVEKVYFLEAFSEEFIAKFTIHVKNLFDRAENNYFAKNPLTSKIKNSFPLIYDIAVYIAQEFKKEYNIHLTEDEITFIAFHIGSYFENTAQAKTKVNCAFIYADYYSIHKNALNKISMRFENQLNIKYAISIDNYNANTLDCDLIISTIDMPYPTRSVIIQPFLTDKDIRRLDDTIETLFQKKRNHLLKNHLLDFFDERLFYRSPNFKNRETAIKRMAKDAVNIDFADETLAEDIMARETMASTAFNNVAIPHSLRQNAKTSFISVAINESPINWGDSQINMIAMIGINEDSRKLFAELFDSLIDILSEPTNIKELIKAHDFNDFMNILKKLMDD